MRFIFNRVKFLAISLLVVFFTACTTIDVNVSHVIGIPANAPIVIGPLANHSDTPLANRQVESMLVGFLQSQGFKNTSLYPRPNNCEKLLYCADETFSTNQLLAWGRAHHAAFILTGSANEWRYKVGLDGEPVAGVSLMLLDVRSGKIVWTGVGSIIGNSRLGLDVVGQRLLQTLVISLHAVC